MLKFSWIGLLRIWRMTLLIIGEICAIRLIIKDSLPLNMSIEYWPVHFILFIHSFSKICLIYCFLDWVFLWKYSGVFFLCIFTNNSEIIFEQMLFNLCLEISRRRAHISRVLADPLLQLILHVGVFFLHGAVETILYVIIGSSRHVFCNQRPFFMVAILSLE